MNIKRVLNDRQLRRAKFSIGAAAAGGLLSFVSSQAAQTYMYDGKSWDLMQVETYTRGSVAAFSNTEEICDR